MSLVPINVKELLDTNHLLVISHPKKCVLLRHGLKMADLNQ